MHEDKSVEANFGEKHADLNYFGRERVSHVEKHIYHVSQTIEREVREEEKKTPPQSHTHTQKPSCYHLVDQSQRSHNTVSSIDTEHEKNMQTAGSHVQRNHWICPV